MLCRAALPRVLLWMMPKQEEQAVVMASDVKWLVRRFCILLAATAIIWAAVSYHNYEVESYRCGRAGQCSQRYSTA